MAIVNVAPPSVQADLGLQHADLQWVVITYGLMLGGLLALIVRYTPADRRSRPGRADIPGAVRVTGGLMDDHTAPVGARFESLTHIAGSVNVPVTADLLDGYGLDADELVERLLGAGAVGRLTDRDITGRLVDELDAAVDANVTGDVSVADLAAAGASRISIGPMAFHAALATIDQTAAGLLAGPTRTGP